MTTAPTDSTTARRIRWPAVLDHAAAIVATYSTPVTLRQLFYRLVSDGTLPNTQNAYKSLSDRSATARRQGWFPELLDLGRAIHVPASWESPADALDALADQYRRDRTEGQPCALYLGVEKRGMVAQLDAWFGDLGVPIICTSGYSSQTYVDQARHHAEQRGTPPVLLYAGDFDPSGEDILRAFDERTGGLFKVVPVALTADQVATYALPENPGKSSDSRAAAFAATHGRLVQVELDALDPDDLRALYQSAVDDHWDPDAHAASLDREDEDVSVLRAIAERMTD